VLLCVVGVAAQATSTTDGSTPLGLSPGAPAGSYSLSGFESVNPYNGNLNFHLPLAGSKGRGALGMVSQLEIDEKRWNIKHSQVNDPNTGLPIDIYNPTPNWWSPKPGYGPGVLIGRKSGLSPNQTCNTTRYIYQQTLTRLTFTAADGTEYEFRDQLTGGQPATVSNPCGSGASRGTIFITADGTAATFISDSTIYDDPQSRHVSMIYPSGYMLLGDGTRYRIDNGNVTWMRDRNGNRLSFAYASGRVTVITDSLNRQISITYADYVNTFSDQITVKGFGGVTRTILVNFTALSNTLRTTNPRGEPASRYQIQTYQSLFPGLNGSSASQYNPYVVSSITLPNGQQYLLQYNSYAELARIMLPTGGAIEYDYTATSGAVTDGDNYQVYRRVIERRIYADGVNLDSYSTYSGQDPFTGIVQVDHLSAAGVLRRRRSLPATAM